MTARTRLWDWLGRPLAVDFANTRARAHPDDVELVQGPWDLEEWARREHPRVPILPRAFAGRTPHAAGRRMREIRELRDAVRAVLHAAAQGVEAPQDALARIHAALVADGSALGELLSRVAMSAIELRARGHIAFCDAPSCGLYFEPTRPNQRWCSRQCGIRARVARHATRTARGESAQIRATSVTSAR